MNNALNHTLSNAISSARQKDQMMLTFKCLPSASHLLEGLPVLLASCQPSLQILNLLLQHLDQLQGHTPRRGCCRGPWGSPWSARRADPRGCAVTQLSLSQLLSQLISVRHRCLQQQFVCLLFLKFVILTRQHYFGYESGWWPSAVPYLIWEWTCAKHMLFRSQLCSDQLSSDQFTSSQFTSGQLCSALPGF